MRGDIACFSRSYKKLEQTAYLHLQTEGFLFDRVDTISYIENAFKACIFEAKFSNSHYQKQPLFQQSYGFFLHMLSFLSNHNN